MKISKVLTLLALVLFSGCKPYLTKSIVHHPGNVSNIKRLGIVFLNANVDSFKYDSFIDSTFRKELINGLKRLGTIQISVLDSTSTEQFKRTIATEGGDEAIFQQKKFNERHNLDAFMIASRYRYTRYLQSPIRVKLEIVDLDNYEEEADFTYDTREKDLFLPFQKKRLPIKVATQGVINQLIQAH